LPCKVEKRESGGYQHFELEAFGDRYWIFYSIGTFVIF